MYPAAAAAAAALSLKPNNQTNRKPPKQSAYLFIIIIIIMAKIMSLYAIALLLAASTVTAQLPGDDWRWCNSGTSGTGYCESRRWHTYWYVKNHIILFFFFFLSTPPNHQTKPKAETPQKIRRKKKNIVVVKVVKFTNPFNSCSAEPASSGPFQTPREIKATSGTACQEDPNFSGTYLGTVYCAA